MSFYRTILSVVLLFCMVGPTLAVPIEITVDFTGSGLSNADQTAVLNQIKAKYVGIDVNITTNAGGAITLNYNNVNGDGAWGDSDKKGHTCKMNAKRWSLGGRAAVFDTAAKRRNLWAETGAHELGHLLCAVHNKDEPNSLMTVGSKVSWAERAADGRSFTAMDKVNIAKGITMLKANKSWDLDANYDQDDVTIIPGNVQPGPDEPDDFGVTFHVEISDSNYAIGYMNELQEFVDWEQPGVLQTDMHFDPFLFVNFAIEQGGVIYPFSTSNGGSIITDLPRSPSEALNSSLGNPYFGRLILIFPAGYVGAAGDIALVLDADVFSPTSGFALEAVSAITTPPPTAAPLLSGWGIIGLLLLFVITAMIVLRHPRAR